MDIKEYAISGVVVIGGIAYGVSQGGLGDALTEDVKDISMVSQEERAAYMGGIVETFSENFAIYIVETDTCLLYTSPSPRDGLLSRMPSSA